MAANSTPQTTPADGTIEEIDGRYVLRFERRFRHPVPNRAPPSVTNGWTGAGTLALKGWSTGRVSLASGEGELGP